MGSDTFAWTALALGSSPARGIGERKVADAIDRAANDRVGTTEEADGVIVPIVGDVEIRRESQDMLVSVVPRQFIEAVTPLRWQGKSQVLRTRRAEILPAMKRHGVANE